MKIFSALHSGLTRTYNAWKGILIYWICSLVLVLLIVAPLKASLKAGLGSSMITEKLSGGLDADVLGDMGEVLHSLSASLFSGTMFLLLAAILVSVFLMGGIFRSAGRDPEKITGAEFFRSSASLFSPNMVIMLLVYLIAAALITVILVIPVSVVSQSETAPEGITFRIMKITGILFVLVISVIYLVADYARAWKASGNAGSGFKALSFGFSQTFRTFGVSYPMMLILVVLQFLPLLLAFRVIVNWTPSGGSGVFLMFIVSQLVFLLRIVLKVYRYSSVTVLMEMIPLTRKKPVIMPVAEQAPGTVIAADISGQAAGVSASTETDPVTYNQNNE